MAIVRRLETIRRRQRLLQVATAGLCLWRGQCWQLRQACLHKEELGEEGMGNCRRYRELCR